jgi:HSP20 family protein
MLMRFDPFRELDRLTEQAWGRVRSQAPAMPMDAYRRGDQLVAEFDLPGVSPESVELTVEKNVLTVKAERHFERAEGDEVLVEERPQGTFTRQLFLGENLDLDHVSAQHQDGVLKVTIPVAEAAKPRRVAVTAGPGSQPIESASKPA